MTDDDRDLLPEGLEDRLPASAAVAARVTRAVMDVLDSHGYDRVQPPSIEFEKSLARRMAGVEPRRMFRFVDPASLRTLALRSDITPQLGRIAATGLAAAARPLRLCYAGQVITIKGDGLDPTRERLQLGGELIGDDGVAAAGEVVSIAIEALSAAGASGISVDFTLPNLIEMLATGPLPVAEGENLLSLLDAKNVGAIPPEYRPLVTACGAFDSAIAKLREFEATIPGGETWQKSQRRQKLLGWLDALETIAAKLPVSIKKTLDPTERHGFEYQSWFGFTLFAEGMSGAIGRGGSYRIAGRHGAAIGFSLYPDPLIDALSASETRRDTLFLPLDHDPDQAGRLRVIGWRTVAALSADDDGRALGCTHRLHGDEAVRY